MSVYIASAQLRMALLPQPLGYAFFHPPQCSMWPLRLAYLYQAWSLESLRGGGARRGNAGGGAATAFVALMRECGKDEGLKRREAGEAVDTSTALPAFAAAVAVVAVAMAEGVCSEVNEDNEDKEDRYMGLCSCVLSPAIAGPSLSIRRFVSTEMAVAAPGRVAPLPSFAVAKALWSSPSLLCGGEAKSTKGVVGAPGMGARLGGFRAAVVAVPAAFVGPNGFIASTAEGGGGVPPVTSASNNIIQGKGHGQKQGGRNGRTNATHLPSPHPLDPVCRG